MVKNKDRISVKLTKKNLWIKDAIKNQMSARERTENFLVTEALREHFKKFKK